MQKAKREIIFGRFESIPWPGFVFDNRRPFGYLFRKNGKTLFLL